MKKLIPLLLALLLLSGCTIQPSIAPAKLTKDEQALLRMFDSSYPQQVFDFVAPEGAVGLIIRRQSLEDGQWVTASHYLQLNGQTGRFAISFDDLADGLRCAILQNGEVESVSATRDAELDTTGMITATTALSTPVHAALHAEIPLLMQLFSHEMPLPSASLNDYPGIVAFSEYDYVYIVTATFTDKPLE